MGKKQYGLIEDQKRIVISEKIYFPILSYEFFYYSRKTNKDKFEELMLINVEEHTINENIISCIPLYDLVGNIKSKILKIDPNYEIVFQNGILRYNKSNIVNYDLHANLMAKFSNKFKIEVPPEEIAFLCFKVFYETTIGKQGNNNRINRIYAIKEVDKLCTVSDKTYCDTVFNVMMWDLGRYSEFISINNHKHLEEMKKYWHYSCEVHLYLEEI